MSTIIQNIKISAYGKIVDFECEIDWHENRKILKVEYPVIITNDVATYETQFGCLQRPTHYNTSWDYARFEVCGHKFVDLSEFGFGVAILNNGYDFEFCFIKRKYGHCVYRNVMRMSVLRSPKAPDANCDMGIHKMKYGFYAHEGGFMESDVIKQGYQFNVTPIVRYVCLVREMISGLVDVRVLGRCLSVVRIWL